MSCVAKTALPSCAAVRAFRKASITNGRRTSWKLASNGLLGTQPVPLRPMRSKTFAVNGPKSWIVSGTDLDEHTYDLSVKNPNAPEAEAVRSPEEIIADMLTRDAETPRILEDIRGML